MIRTLTFSTLYPNAAQQTHGIFVENRLRALLSSGEVTAHAVAPVGCFPFSHRLFGRYGKLARVPRTETRFGISVDHPRYLVIPKIGMRLAPRLLYLGARAHIRRLQAAGQRFDLIDAHYLYPDGVAAVMLARHFGLPVVLTARGSDVTLLPNYPAPRRMILEAVKQADGLVTVSKQLKQALAGLGVPADRIAVLRNGVDVTTFRPLPAETARRHFGFGEKTIGSVGHLIPRKGHDLVIRALAHCPELTLAIVGEGPERGRLDTIAREVGVADRVRFLGALDHDRMPQFYNAVAATALASSREGMANVLLESIACGTPVVATNAIGSAEVVSAPAAGLIVEERTPAAIAAAIVRLLEAPPAKEATRAHGEQFGWLETSKGQLALFNRILKSDEKFVMRRISTAD